MALKKPSDYFRNKEKEETVSIDNAIETLETPSLSTFSDAFESYKNNLSKIQVLSEFTETIDNYRINIERINYISDKINDLQDEIKSSLTKEDLDLAMMAQLVVVEEVVLKLQEKVEGINTKDLQNVNKEIEILSKNVNVIFDSLKGADEVVENFKEDVINKVRSIEVQVVKSETYVKKQNKNLENLQNEVYDTIKRLNIDELEQKNNQLTRKVRYLEEVFDKFNEKILTEGLLNEPPEVENSDPLTPLDQNFVTLDQLQAHYKVFINRVQQQLATLGGGGETRLEFLDDVDRNSAKQDGYLLQYSSSVGKFIGTSYVPGGGGGGESLWQPTNVGIHTLSNVGIGTTIVTSALTVYGDASISGILTAQDFNSASDIKLKQNVKKIDNALDKILNIDGVHFEWKKSGKKSMGVIAQKVEEVCPELVSGFADKTVNYNGIIALLIECVKEQQKEIEYLKEHIDK